MLLLVFGFLAAAVLLPATAPAPDVPDIRVPRMQNAATRRAQARAGGRKNRKSHRNNFPLISTPP
jgi:hypothetical protein